MTGTLALAIYGSVVATFTAIWRIFEFWHDRRGRIKIEFSKIMKAPVNVTFDVLQPQAFLKIVIVNKGKNKRVIRRPEFEIDKEYQGTNKIYYQDFYKASKFPQSLDSMQESVIELEAKPLLEIARLGGANQITVVISDTVGKVYKSNPITITQLVSS
jgi:hypothetical protein